MIWFFLILALIGIFIFDIPKIYYIRQHDGRIVGINEEGQQVPLREISHI